MNDEPTEHTNHNPGDSAANGKTASRERKHDGRAGAASEFAQRASEFAKSLPVRIDDQLRRNPYAVLAAVGAAAAVAGIVMSSRVLRAALTATMTALAVDVGRALIRQTHIRVERESD